MDKYGLWFGSIKALSDRSLNLVFELGMTPELLYHLSKPDLDLYFPEEETEKIIIARKFWDLEGEYEKVNKQGLQFVSYLEENYPAKLRDMVNPPKGLYYNGKLPDPDKPSFSIVGARKCSPYGREIATSIGRFLGENDVQVVSGMALGIDGFAQRGAIDGGGDTFAVLGTGADVCYPQSNIGLFTDIQCNGGILSEYPPGMLALPHHFPERNRIISGLSDVVIVVEAEERSGSLITADFALEQGKDVLAIPGKTTDRTSYGCNYLIYQGAEIYLGVKSLKNHMERLWEERGVSRKFKNSTTEKKTIPLEKKESMVYSCLSLQPKRLEEILTECPLTFAEIQGVLMDLQLKGYVKEVTKNRFVSVET